MSAYSEDALVEQPAIALLAGLGWETVDCFNERFGADGTLGRETKQEVVLRGRLRAALQRLNPGVPGEAIAGAVEELARDRGALGAAQANQEVYRLLKDGVKVDVRGEDGEEATETVRVVDWREPRNNDFLLASQVWIAGDMTLCRPDLIGFVNGLPLVLAELKATHQRLKDAYERNLADYKRSIPHLFPFNALILLSNGGESRVGSVTAGWEHFGEWKKVEAEEEPGVVSLEAAIRGTCAPARLLDLVENFTLFTPMGGGLIKLVAKNHQYLGVNNAVAALRRNRAGAAGADRGRLGVFWHTQGSGKSYSMVFFVQKVLRTVPGNHTFVIVTDRQELDDQIYRTFTEAGAVTEKKVQAGSGAELKRLLRADHRTVFTLIQKFRAPEGEPYPVLSERSDVTVITDEAHRSQYDVFAMNMRRALPNAAFIGFTGTPLLAGEERTREVFGDYVSVYNFRQSVRDGATVPLYYENRIPELELTNPELNADLEGLIARAELDEEEETSLERRFAREYHLIVRDDRLEAIAEDIVRHFLGRGHRGKAMVVSVDKATAVRMYDKVRKHWWAERERLAREGDGVPEGEEGAEESRRLRSMDETDMAVVVSEGPGEDKEFVRRGLKIAPHRRRMQTEELDEKFKDPDDPLRIVFVCAMWLTGFDAPSVSTMYLDKPMRNHTLMQTIARANRVFPGKTNGLIVDYVGVFRNLQEALAIYGSEAGGGVAAGDSPVASKAELVAKLGEAIAGTEGFLAERGVEVERIRAAGGLEKLRLLEEAVEALLVDDETRRRYLSHVNGVALLFKAILPDPAAMEFGRDKTLLEVIARKIRNVTPTAVLGEIEGDVEALLDASIETEGYAIREDAEGGMVDLSRLDVEGLRARVAAGRPHTETERLRAAIELTLDRLVALNRTRTDFRSRFAALIDAYNAGSRNVQLVFEELVAFAQELQEEEQRAVGERLSEEELALFDLLTRPGPDLTDAETERVKTVARELLANLKRERLILDWRHKQQARARVRVTIGQALDAGLSPLYSPPEVEQKVDEVYQHVYDSYAGQGRSIYGVEAPGGGAYRYR